MKPKDKALEPTKKMHACGGYGFEFEDAKQCALVAVDELIKYDKDYWTEVQSEINNIFAQ